MTKQEAIEILSSKTSLVAVEKLKYYAGFNRDAVIEQIQEAMDMGAEALKRQIAEKPYWEGEGRYINAFCPNCSSFLDDDEDCEVCGQKIDWS